MTDVQKLYVSCTSVIGTGLGLETKSPTTVNDFCVNAVKLGQRRRDKRFNDIVSRKHNPNTSKINTHSLFNIIIIIIINRFV